MKEVDSPENFALLKRATGVWFGGGRQWHFIDAYEGTKTAELLRDVLKRGGVIGGSSAGATIRGDYLVRGSPFGSEIMMCEGYERAFGFLPGVAIDQHFSAGGRFPDMTALMDKYPQFLGIGLDESTAVVVQGHTARSWARAKFTSTTAAKSPPTTTPTMTPRRPATSTTSASARSFPRKRSLRISRHAHKSKAGHHAIRTAYVNRRGVLHRETLGFETLSGPSRFASMTNRRRRHSQTRFRISRLSARSDSLSRRMARIESP